MIVLLFFYLIFFGSILIFFTFFLILFNRPLFFLSFFFPFFPLPLFVFHSVVFCVQNTHQKRRAKKTHAPHATRRSPQNRRPSRVSIVADLSINPNLQPPHIVATFSWIESTLVRFLFFLFSAFFLSYFIHLFLCFSFSFSPSLYHFPLSCPGGKSVLSGLTLSFSGSTSESPSGTGATVEIRIQNRTLLCVFLSPHHLLEDS